MKKNKTSFSIRMDADLRKAVESAAVLGKTDPAHIIRLCVAGGLPIVCAGFDHMKRGFEAQLADVNSAPAGNSSVPAASKRITALAIETKKAVPTNAKVSKPTQPAAKASGHGPIPQAQNQ
jgi:hypothetical protein